MKKTLFLFLAGGLIYIMLELAWRGRTHISMFIAGGLSLALINKICCNYLQNKNTFIKCSVSSLIITIIEFITGVVVNIGLNMKIWDYSLLPFNFMGQICLTSFIVWFFLSIPAMIICRLFGKIEQAKT